MIMGGTEIVGSISGNVYREAQNNSSDIMLPQNRIFFDHSEFDNSRILKRKKKNSSSRSSSR